MKIEKLTEEKELAEEKYREYKDAAKKTRDPLYAEMRKVYYQIKKGKQVIDIFKAIQGGGIWPDTLHPKLAVAKAKGLKVWARYKQDGHVEFCNSNRRGWSRKEDIFLPACLPQWKSADGQTWKNLDLEAPVPIIPPRLRPANLTDDYYILWEVDAWKMVISRDPYLLKRITKNLFVICAAWDLTNVEMAVMAGRVKE